MRGRVGSTLFKLALASLLVGLVLKLLNIDPRNLLAGLGEWARSLFEVVVGFVEWTIPYVLLGAVVVLPIWLVAAGWRHLRGRTSR